jgi:membrane-associated phospholipid phosphatase
MPRIRAAAAVVSLAMLLSLVLMNYHFVGDVIAGAFLGGIMAVYAVHVARLQTPPEKYTF